MATLYTIGHSNHSFEEFIEILTAHQIKHIVDVRTVPKSRYVPWFSKTSLEASLKKEKIKYTHMPELGGLRKPHADSINEAWRNAGFRGFADYMQTPEFYLNLKRLNALLKQPERLAIMCAEAVPWRCHRSLISDAEIVRGVSVLDIFSPTNIKPHSLTSFAVVNRHKRPIQVYYPAARTPRQLKLH